VRPDIATGREVQRLEARFRRERRRGIVTLVAAAAAVVTLAGTLTVGAVKLVGGDGSHDGLTTSAPVLPAPAATITPLALPRGAEVTSSARGFLTPSPDLVVNDVLWVDDLADGRVVRINPSNMQILSSVNYEMQSGLLPGALTRSGNVVLLPIAAPAKFGPTVIVRFDATTGAELPGIIVAAAGAIVATSHGVFATVAPDTVGVLDVARGRVLRTFAMPVDRALAYAHGLLWGWDIRHALLVGVDPSRGARVREFSLPGYSDHTLTALDDRTLLIDAPDGTAELDVATGHVTAFTHARAVNYAQDATGGLWGVVDGRALVELDAASLSMLRSYAVRDLGLVAVAAGGRLFAADSANGRVRALDLSKLRAGR
jgi:hypothetical protein